jgi:hypothetical protein
MPDNDLNHRDSIRACHAMDEARHFSTALSSNWAS